jgi:hypothetical protein
MPEGGQDGGAPPPQHLSKQMRGGKRGGSTRPAPRLEQAASDDSATADADAFDTKAGGAAPTKGKQ